MIKLALTNRFEKHFKFIMWIAKQGGVNGSNATLNMKQILVACAVVWMANVVIIELTHSFFLCFII